MTHPYDELDNIHLRARIRDAEKALGAAKAICGDRIAETLLAYEAKHGTVYRVDQSEHLVVPPVFMETFPNHLQNHTE